MSHAPRPVSIVPRPVAVPAGAAATAAGVHRCDRQSEMERRPHRTLLREGRSIPGHDALPDLSGSQILFVDDEPSLRRLARAFLGSLHAEVVAVASPFEALHRIESERQRPDILITDYSMPGLNGEELCGLARRLMPELPVVIISATVCRVEIERLSCIPDSRFLSKPFSLHGLADEVEALIEDRPRPQSAA